MLDKIDWPVLPLPFGRPLGFMGLRHVAGPRARSHDLLTLYAADSATKGRRLAHPFAAHESFTKVSLRKRDRLKIHVYHEASGISHHSASQTHDSDCLIMH